MPWGDKFPLSWPEAWKRTPAHAREKSRWRVDTSRMVAELNRQVGLFSANVWVISSNMPRSSRDGGILLGSTGLIQDPGVALYYSTNKWKERVIACDKYANAFHNMYAIALTLDALRAIERAGASQILDQAFTAFGALPAAAGATPVRPWWEVLGLQEAAIKGGYVDLTMVEAKFRELARAAHPDRNGGDDTAFKELNAAIEQARGHFKK